MSRLSPTLVAFTFASLLLAPSAWGAGASEACARAAEQAQVEKSHGRLRAAAETLLICVRPSCPAFLRRDCATWQEEVDAGLPSVVISARDTQGHDVANVKVTVDGAPFLEKLDGLAKPLDPGEHDLRFETAGALPTVQHLILREGEKRRAVQVNFDTGPAPKPAETAPAIASADAARPREESVSPLVYIFGGAAILSLGGFAYLGATGLDDYNTLKNGCGRTGSCASSDVSSARTKLWVADALLAVGIVSVGAAGWFFFRSTSNASPSAIQLEVHPTAGGGFAGASGRF